MAAVIPVQPPKKEPRKPTEFSDEELWSVYEEAKARSNHTVVKAVEEEAMRRMEGKMGVDMAPLVAMAGAAAAAAGYPALSARMAARTGRGAEAVALLRKGGYLGKADPDVITEATLGRSPKLGSQANMMFGIPDVNPTAASFLTKHLRSKLDRAKNMAKQDVPYGDIGKETGWFLLPIKGVDARSGKKITRLEWLYNLPTKQTDFDADAMLKAMSEMDPSTVSRSIPADTVVTAERGLGKLLATMGYDLKNSTVVFKPNMAGEAGFTKTTSASPDGSTKARFELTINSKLFTRVNDPYRGDAAKTKLAELLDHEFTHGWDKIVGNPETGSSTATARAQMEAAGEIKPFSFDNLETRVKTAAHDAGTKVLTEFIRVAHKHRLTDLVNTFRNTTPGELFDEWTSIMDEADVSGFVRDPELFSAMQAMDEIVRAEKIKHVATNDPKVYARYSADFGEVKAKAAELGGNAATVMKGAIARLKRLEASEGAPRLHTSPMAGEIAESAQTPAAVRTIQIGDEQMTFPQGASDAEIMEVLTEIYGHEAKTGAKAGEKTLVDSATKIMDLDTGELLIPAAHATPHTFNPVPGNQLGAFDLNKMLTGEGAMAYGPGAYLSTDEGVLSWYHKNFTRDKISAFFLDDTPVIERDVNMRDVISGVSEEAVVRSRAGSVIHDSINRASVQWSYHERRGSMLANSAFYTAFNKMLPVRDPGARNYKAIEDAVSTVATRGYFEADSLRYFLDKNKFLADMTLDDVIQKIREHDQTRPDPSMSTMSEMFEHEISRDRHLKKSYSDYISAVQTALDTPFTIIRSKRDANVYETVMRVQENHILDLNEPDPYFLDRMKAAVKKMDRQDVTDAVTDAWADLGERVNYPMAVIHAAEGFVDSTDMLKLLDLAGYKVSRYMANSQGLSLNYVIHDPKVSTIWKKRGVMGMLTVATMTGAVLTEPQSEKEQL